MSKVEDKSLQALKQALQYAKELHDAGLVDDSEFKDLKSHELAKYKKSLKDNDEGDHEGDVGEAVTPVTTAKGIKEEGKDGKEVKEGMLEREEEVVDEMLFKTPSPQIKRVSSLVKRGAVEDLASVKRLIRLGEPSIFERLTTPPIFKRKSRVQKRTIVMDSKDIATL